jgi:hypothetical protein
MSLANGGVLTHRPIFRPVPNLRTIDGAWRVWYVKAEAFTVTKNDVSSATSLVNSEQTFRRRDR